MNLKESVEDWDTSYGILAKWIWRLIFYPLLALVFYSANSYLGANFVKHSEFEDYKKVITQQAKENFNNSEISRLKLSDEQKVLFEKMGVKLDSLLLHDSANMQGMTDVQRRLSRCEDKLDSLEKR